MLLQVAVLLAGQETPLIKFTFNVRVVQGYGWLRLGAPGFESAILSA